MTRSRARRPIRRRGKTTTKTKANADAIPPRRDLQLDAARRDSRGQAARPRALLPRRRDPDDASGSRRRWDSRSRPSSTFSRATRSRRRSPRTAPAARPSPTGGRYKVEADRRDPAQRRDHDRARACSSRSTPTAPSMPDGLNTEAAKTIKWGGLTEDEAFALVTINPAKQLRIDNRVGSLEVGQGRRRRHLDCTTRSARTRSSNASTSMERSTTTAEGRGRPADGAQEREVELAAAEGNSTRPATTTPQEDPRATGRDGEADSDARQQRTAADDDSDRPAASNGHGVSPAERRTQTAKPAQEWRGRAITNATIHPVTRADDRARDDRDPRQRIEAIRRRHVRFRLARRSSTPPGRRLSRIYQCAHDARARRTGPAGLRRRERDARLQPASLRTRVAYHSESDAIPVARANGITTVGVIPGGGILAGEVAVMNLDGWTWEEATLQRERRHHVQLPGARRRRRTRWRRRYAAAVVPRVRRPSTRSSATVTAGSTSVARLLDHARAYAKAGPDKTVDWTLEALVPVVERKLPLSPRSTVRRTSRTPWRLPIASRSTSSSAAAPKPRRRAAAQGEEHSRHPGQRPGDAGPRRRFHAATYQLAGELANAGVKIAFSTGDNANVRILPYHAAMSVAWGIEARGRDQGADRQCCGDPRCRGSRRQHRDRQGRELLHLEGRPTRRSAPWSPTSSSTARTLALDNKHEALYRKYIARPYR